MKKLFLILLLFKFGLFASVLVPGYYGARSLALGYSTTAFNFDVNVIFINPALLSGLSYSLSGYQFQDSHRSYPDFLDNLNRALEYDLQSFDKISDSERGLLLQELRDLFQPGRGLFGSKSSLPGFIAGGYGISYGIVKETVVTPVQGDILNKDDNDIGADDIATLGMNFLSLNYKQISLSYGMDVSRGLSFGVTLHYLYGKTADFNASLLGDVFNPDSRTRTYLEHGWDNVEDKFSKIIGDLGFSMNLGAFFKVGLVFKNAWNAKIKTAAREITLNKRVIAGLAFKPDARWAMCLDLDITKNDLLYDGSKMQPVSLGIERSFFKNTFFLRAGLLSDLTGKYFIGKKANVLYGLGMGFNLRSFVVDLALGVDSAGRVNSLAISGFYLMK